MASQAVLQLIAELKDNASSGLASIGGALSSLGTVALGVAAVGVAAVGAALVSGVADAREANALLAQTESIITSTGGAAGMTATQVTDLATQLSAAQGKSLFGDSQVQAAENVLIKYKELKGIIPDVTQLSVDMAARLGGEPAAAAESLGRALAVPEAAAGKLAKMGIILSDAQEKQIKTMVAAGNTAGAQAIIMGQLQNSFGGAAQAAADADGGWAQFKDRMGEAAESAGAALLPMLGMVAGFLNDTIVPIVEAAAAGFTNLVAAFQVGAEGGDFLGGIVNALYSLDSVSPVFTTIGDGLVVLGDVATNVVLPALAEFAAFLNDTVLPAVGAGLTDAFTFLSGTVLPALAQGWIDLQPAIAAVIAFIGDNLNPILDGLGAVVLTIVIPAFVAWALAAGTAAVATLAALAPILIPLAAIGVAVALLKAAWDSDFGGIRTTLTQFWESTGRPIFEQLGAWLSTTIPAAVSTVSDFFTGTLWPALQTVWAFIDANVIPIVGALANVWFALLKKEVELLAALWSNVLWPALQKVGEFITGTVVPAFQAAGAKMDEVGATINSVLGPAFNWLNENVLGPVTASFGHISDAVGDVIGFLKRLADSINAIEIPAWLQGHSPPPLADWFDYIGVSIRGVAGSDLPDLQGALDDAGGILGDVSSGALPSFGGALTDAGAAVRVMAAGVGGDLQTAIDGIADSFGDSDAPDDAEGLGVNILDALAQGVASTISNVVGATHDAAQSILDEIKDVFEVSSPSAVMVELGSVYIGSPFMDAITGAITAGLPALAEGLDGVIEAMRDSVKDGEREAVSAMEAAVRAITSAASKLPDLIADATAGMFEVTADVNRIQERNLARLSDFDPYFQDAIAAELQAAQAAAALLPDPADADAFFKLRSKQIFELADLEKQNAEAGVAEQQRIETEHARTAGQLAKTGADLQTQLANATTDEQRAAIQAKIDDNQRAQDAEQAAFEQAIQRNAELANAEKLRLNQRITLIRAAQEAEQEALKTHQEHDLTVFEQMAQGVRDLISAIPSGIQLPPNWLTTIAAYQQVLAQLTALYHLPPPPVFLPQPAPTGQGLTRGGNGLAETGIGGGSVILQAGAIALTLPNTSESEARRFVDRVITLIDQRRKGRG